MRRSQCTAHRAPLARPHRVCVGCRTPSNRAAADEARRRFLCPQGDTLTLVNVLSAFGAKHGPAARAWCAQHHVNRRTVEQAALVRKQLCETCIRLELPGASAQLEAPAPAPASASAAPPREGEGPPQMGDELSRTLRRCLTCAFFQNAAQRQPSGEYLALTSREAVAIHPSSCLFQRRATCVRAREGPHGHPCTRAPVHARGHAVHPLCACGHAVCALSHAQGHCTCIACASQVLFNELLFTSKLYMRDLTQIDAEWLPECAPHYFAAKEAVGDMAAQGGRLAEIARDRG